MNGYQSCVKVSDSPNCCNPFTCTKCGATGASPYCCDEDDRMSDLARLYFGPHPILNTTRLWTHTPPEQIEAELGLLDPADEPTRPDCPRPSVRPTVPAPASRDARAESAIPQVALDYGTALDAITGPRPKSRG